MADSIVVKYQDNLDELIKQLKIVSEQNKALTKQVDDFGNKSKVAGDKAAASLGQVNKTASAGENLFNKLGTQIAAAFSVGAILAWSATALGAYKEQQKALVQLKASLETVANEGTQAFNKLVKQAERLQKVSIFSDEQIEQTQTALINFGLTSRQVETLTARVIDFASRTGKSLEESTGIFLRAIQGQTRGLIDAGAKFDDTGSRVGNFNALLQSTEKFAGGAAIALGTQAGQLQNIANQIDDINEETGRQLSGLELAFAKTKLAFSQIAASFFATGNISFSIRSLFFPKDEAEKLPKELDQIAKAMEQIAAKRDRILQASLGLNKSILGFSDKDIQDEIKRLNSLDQANTIAIKDRIDLLNKEIEARKKAREKNAGQAEKDAKEAFDRQQELNKKSADETLQIQLANLEKAKQDELAIEETSVAEKLLIDRKYLLQRALLFEDDKIEQAKIAAQISEIDKKLGEQRIKDASDASDAVTKQNAEALEKQVKDQKAAEERKRENIQATFDAAQNLAGQLIQLFSDNDQAQIESINNRKDAANDAIDEQLEKLEEANDKGKISDKKFEAEKKRLLDLRKFNEKKAAEETKKIKQAEAEREKAYSIFSIILSTARAIMAALASVPPNPFLATLAGIVGAAELAIATATPIPQFAIGTDKEGKRKSGMGIVGERGAELIFMPQGTQVLTAEKTRRHRAAIDAMIEGNYEQYVYKSMIAPALREATRKMEKDRQKSFAENIANHFSMSNETNPYRVYDGVKMNNKELADAIARAMMKYGNNNSNDRYYH